MSGNGISWAICKSAPCSRQITTPAPSFLQAGCHSCRPTNSVKALKALTPNDNNNNNHNNVDGAQVLAECCKRQLNQVSLVLLYFRLSVFFLICIKFVYLYFPLLFCLSVSVKWLAVKTASEMTYTVSGGALNSIQTKSWWCYHHDQSHCESSPVSFDECRLSTGWPPTPRPSQSTWAESPPKTGSYRPHPPSPLLLLLSWYSFYRPTAGGRLSRPRRCGKGAQPVHKAVYRSSCRDKCNRLRCDPNLGPITPPSDTLTTRLRRPVCVCQTIRVRWLAYAAGSRCTASSVTRSWTSSLTFTTSSTRCRRSAVFWFTWKTSTPLSSCQELDTAPYVSAIRI